jgi:hypothetical protein
MGSINGIAYARLGLMPLLCANLFKHQAEPDVVAETGPTELVETLSRYANSGLAESGDVKNNFFEDYSGLAETVRLECAPGGGQSQAAFLTVCRA